MAPLTNPEKARRMARTATGEAARLAAYATTAYGAGNTEMGDTWFAAARRALFATA